MIDANRPVSPLDESMMARWMTAFALHVDLILATGKSANHCALNPIIA
jgi:hypothetical protein